jgi:hypothetical protein
MAIQTDIGWDVALDRHAKKWCTNVEHSMVIVCGLRLRDCDEYISAMR